MEADERESGRGENRRQCPVYRKGKMNMMEKERGKKGEREQTKRAPEVGGQNSAILRFNPW